MSILSKFLPLSSVDVVVVLDTEGKAEKHVLNREYYGNDSENKPNDHCVWTLGPFETFPGWHETDEHFKARLAECTHSPKS